MKHVEDWWFMVVYASPNDSGKKLLWEGLKNIARDMKDGWMIAGDFNHIASVSGKKGGLPASSHICQRMRDIMDVCSVKDMETRGPKFTWRGPIFHGGQIIYEKLDRALSNDNWRIRFP